MLKTEQDIKLDSEDLVETVAANVNLESRFIWGGARQASHVDTAVTTGTNESREIGSERFYVVPAVTSHAGDGQRSFFACGFVGEPRGDIEPDAIQETSHWKQVQETERNWEGLL